MSNQMTAYNGVLDIPVAEQMKHTTPGLCRHLSSHGRRIGWAFDTPFKWTKQIASHFGGTRQGLRGKWPGHITMSVASARSSTLH